MTHSKNGKAKSSAIQIAAIVLVIQITLVFSACDDPSVNPFAPSLPSLTLTPNKGSAPLQVTLDASQSQGRGLLTYRFDINGDGTFDTDFSTEAILETIYENAGTFRAVVEVKNEAGDVVSAEADTKIQVQPALADLDVDVNRDEKIDASDELGENAFTAERGAMLLSNIDDDDGDAERDFFDEEIDTAADYAEMAKVILQHSPALQKDDQVALRIEPAVAKSRIRIFQVDNENTQVLLSPQMASQNSALLLNTAALKEGSIVLWVEGLGRSANWNGELHLTLEIERSGKKIASDEVLLSFAPVIFPDNIQRARELFIMRITDWRYGENTIFYDAIQAALPNDVPLTPVDQYVYGGDRWVQDNMQGGYQRIATENGTRSIAHYLNTSRWRGGDGLEHMVTNELLNIDFGFSELGGTDTSLNYGGNLEIAPPHENYPFGRLLYGGGNGGTILGRTYSDQMNANQLGWLNGQEVQAPALELSSEWLVVGHLDEIFLFVPDHRTVAEGAKAGQPWKIIFASPELAIAKLEEIEADGFGAEIVFARRETSRTVAQILNDDEQMSYNTAVQTRIDSVRLILMSALNLNDDDILEVPVMYENDVYQGIDLSVAHNPGIQNLIVIDSKDQNGIWFIPDPEGPQVNGVDVWKDMTQKTLEPLGATLKFVDVFESYHLLYGEAHCGSNVRRDAYNSQWWNQP